MASPIHQEVDVSISIERNGSSLDVSGTRSPYPFFAAKRVAEPVWHGTVMDYGVVPPEMIPDDEYTLFTYPLVSQAFREHSKFSSSGYDSTMGLIIGPSMLGMTGQKTSRSSQSGVKGVPREVTCPLGARVHRPDLRRVDRRCHG